MYYNSKGNITAQVIKKHCATPVDSVQVINKELNNENITNKPSITKKKFKNDNE